MILVSGRRCSADEAFVFARDGRPAATIYCLKQEGDADAKTAAILADYVKRMSGAELDVVALGAVREVPTAPGPLSIGAKTYQAQECAVLLGELARQAGLDLPKTSVSKEGFRILTRGKQLLIAGESPIAVQHAVYRLLQKFFGCGWYMDLKIGIVVPEQKTVSLPATDLSEAPSFIFRSVWGGNWAGEGTDYRNGILNGGIGLSSGHAWAGLLPPDKYFKDHPEYFGLRGGQRVPGLICTSNDEATRAIAEGIIASLDAAPKGPFPPSISLSPTDTSYFCECEKCRALDVPGYIEPSSNQVNLSDRFMNWATKIAQIVTEKHPEARFGFYAYSCYTLPPVREKVHPAVTVLIAPIRYSRYHAIGSPYSFSRRRLASVVEGWAKAGATLGWREYNFNLADLQFPFCKASTWGHDLPWLYERGCRIFNEESSATWPINGPHIWVGAQLAWDVTQKSDDLLRQFCIGTCGKAAGEHVYSYWQRIDRAYQTVPSESGSIWAAPLIWTPQFLAACQNDLDRAAKAAEKGTPREQECVALFQSGLDCARLMMKAWDETNRFDFPAAKKTLDELRALQDTLFQKRWCSDYQKSYLWRFASAHIELMALRIEKGAKIAAKLPDVWRMRYDYANMGLDARFMAPDLDESRFREVKTYSATLDSQGVDEWNGIIWYRTRFTLKDKPKGRMYIFFCENADKSTIYLNGKEVGTGPARAPFEVEITGAAKEGENVLAVRLDHTKITELSLYGILRPVLVYEAPEGAWPPALDRGKNPASG